MFFCRSYKVVLFNSSAICCILNILGLTSYTLLYWFKPAYFQLKCMSFYILWIDFSFILGEVGSNSGCIGQRFEGRYSLRSSKFISAFIFYCGFKKIMIFWQKWKRVDELIILHCFFGSVPFDTVVETRCFYVHSSQILFHFDIKIYLYSKKYVEKNNLTFNSLNPFFCACLNFSRAI